MGHVLRIPTLASIVLAAWLCTSTARAYEDQAGISADLTYGRVVPDSSRPNGLLLGATGSIGLDDIWTARLRLAYGFHPGTDAAPSAIQVGLLSAELLYLFDILEWVPYIGPGADAMTVYDSGSLGAEAGGHIVVGIDWLATRELVVGGDVRLLTLLSDLDQRPFYMAFTLSIGWLFEL